MAQTVTIPGTEATAKICNVVGVGALSLVPFYTWIFWYRINREMADLGRARGTDELGTSPGKSLLTVTLGALIIVPTIMSYFGTHKRIVAAQKLTNRTPINGWLSIVLYFAFSPGWIAYMQSGLNSVWESADEEPAAAVAELAEVADDTARPETAAETSAE